MHTFLDDFNILQDAFYPLDLVDFFFNYWKIGISLTQVYFC